METMKAVCIHSFGDLEVLQLENVARPELGVDEILAQVRAASVNPVDYKMHSGGYSKPEQLPLGLWRDISGTIARCGTHVRAKGNMVQPNAAQLSRIAILTDEGKVRPCVETIFPLRDAAKAQLHLEEDHVRGKPCC